VEQGVVEKSGSWFSFAGERLGQGRDNARLLLKENAALRQRIETAVREKIGLAALSKPPGSEMAQAASKTA